MSSKFASFEIAFYIFSLCAVLSVVLGYVLLQVKVCAALLQVTDSQ
jgi:hypothetical protein